MTDFSKFDKYEINEKDIDTVLRYLRLVAPEKATPEHAIDFLEYYQSIIHEAGHISSDEDMEKLYERFSKQERETN